MRARMLIGAALSVLLVSGLSNAETQGTGGAQQSMMKPDSGRSMGMMQSGMTKGMTGRGQQKGMMRGPGGQMMGPGKAMMGMQSTGGMMGKMMDPLHGYIRTLVHASGWLSKLDLSDQQRTKIEAIRAGFLKRKVDAQAVMEKTRIDLNLVTESRAESGKIKQLLDKYYRAKAKLQMDAYITVQQIHKLLTPQQRKIFDAAVGNGGPCPGCMGMMMGKHGMMRRP